MNINEVGEFGFIEQLKKRYVPWDKSIIKGIGDDVGVFERDENSAVLITTDMLIEDIHFRLKDISPHDLGSKSLAVNLSDIAAMGGIPQTACVSLAVPENVSYEFLMNFYEGMEPLLEEFNVMLIGGAKHSPPNGYCKGLCFYARETHNFCKPSLSHAATSVCYAQSGLI